jgi:hypothetical protein
LCELLDNFLSLNQSFKGYKEEQNFPAINHHHVQLNTRCIIGSAGGTQMILPAMEIIL